MNESEKLGLRAAAEAAAKRWEANAAADEAERQQKAVERRALYEKWQEVVQMLHASVRDVNNAVQPHASLGIGRESELGWSISASASRFSSLMSVEYDGLHNVKFTHKIEKIFQSDLVTQEICDKQIEDFVNDFLRS